MAVPLTEAHMFSTKVQTEEVYPKHLADFYLHILPAIITLVIGPFQFLKSFRNNGWHVILGRIYVFCVMIGGTGGFALAWVSYGGPWAHAYFVLLSTYWIATVILSFHYIRKYDIVLHRRWMIRNYFMTWSSVTLRLCLIPCITYNLIQSKGKGSQDPTPTQYVVCIWLSGIIQAVAAELFIRYDPDAKAIHPRV